MWLDRRRGRTSRPRRRDAARDAARQKRGRLGRHGIERPPTAASCSSTAIPTTRPRQMPSGSSTTSPEWTTHGPCESALRIAGKRCTSCSTQVPRQPEACQHHGGRAILSHFLCASQMPNSWSRWTASPRWRRTTFPCSTSRPRTRRRWSSPPSKRCEERKRLVVLAQSLHVAKLVRELKRCLSTLK